MPDPLPRWDDICVAVLWLAGDQGHLKYTRSRPDLAASSLLGKVDKKLIPVLEALGLLQQSYFADAAETILWRDDWPRERGIDITCDPRFTQAVTAACNAMPVDIRTEMDRLVTITEEHVAKSYSRGEAIREQARQKYGKDTNKRQTLETARRDVEFSRSSALDWLFFRRWRLADGWLTLKEAERALEIFHDPLAIKMRRAVVCKLYDGLVLAELGGG